MKLVSCYIRNFGCLKGVSVDFTDGLNQFICNNGIGKTTLISFLKAMLYGLDYRQGRTKFYERQHFLPWDKSDCGGSLVISVNDKKYRIDRSFAQKQAEDTFVLFDEDSMRESNDYGMDIGEKLFGVDKESFEKSLFFGQGALDTAITNSLNAKMGNVSDVRDDMNRFDEAIKSIEKARQEYVKKGQKNPGKLTLLEQEIKNCEETIEQIPILENAVRERKRGIEDKRQKIKDLLSKKNELSKKIREAGERKEKEGAINAKKEHLEKLSKELESQKGFFNGNIPHETDIEDMQKIHRSYVETKARLAEVSARIPNDERIDFLASVFGGDNPATEEMLERSKQDAQQIAKLRASGQTNTLPDESEKALMLAREFFSEKLPTSDEITGLMRQTEIINKSEAEKTVLLQRLSETNARLDALSEKKNRPYMLILCIGIVALLSGLLIGLFDLANQLYIMGTVSGLALGAIFIVVSLMLLYQDKVSSKKTIRECSIKKSEIESQIEEKTRESVELVGICKSFISNFKEFDDNDDIISSLLEIQRRLVEYERLEQLYEAAKKDTAENTDALAELTMNLYTRLSPLANLYDLDIYNDHKEGELLQVLSEDIREYDEYLENTALKKEIESELEKIIEPLDLFMNRYEWDDEKSTEQRLLSLKGRLEAINSTNKQIMDLNVQIEEIPEEDINEFNMDELQREYKSLDEEHQPLLSDVAREEEELSRILNEIEEKEEVGRGLSALKEKKIEMQEKVDVLEDTKIYLEQAKDDFLSVYMKPLREKMDKYINAFMPEYDADFRIVLDMDLTIKVESRGSIFSGEYLSAGYNDMAAMCARLSLIDVLYKNNRPPIFMDDPFTNLDKTKIQKALDMLQEISGETQVLYFTCHDSRVVEGSKIFAP